MSVLIGRDRDGQTIEIFSVRRSQPDGLRRGYRALPERAVGVARPGDAARRLGPLDGGAQIVLRGVVERGGTFEHIERLQPLRLLAVPDQRVETLHPGRGGHIGRDLARQTTEARRVGEALPRIQRAVCMTVGSASCRERVWQYGESLVVVLSYKKQNTIRR